MTGFVYFALGFGKDPGDKVESVKAIKIGYAKDIERRFKALRAGCPYRICLYHSEPGTKLEERILHDQFAHFRMYGEWFRPNTAIDNHVRRRKREISGE